MNSRNLFLALGRSNPPLFFVCLPISCDIQSIFLETHLCMNLVQYHISSGLYDILILAKYVINIRYIQVRNQHKPGMNAIVAYV